MGKLVSISNMASADFSRLTLLRASEKKTSARP